MHPRHGPADAAAPRVASVVSGDAWHLTVSNQGPGLAPEQLRHLTTPFYRADGTAGVGYERGLGTPAQCARAAIRPLKRGKLMATDKFYLRSL
ncbi:MAG: ATP-binding protein [Thiotrichales bacterium]